MTCGRAALDRVPRLLNSADAVARPSADEILQEHLSRVTMASQPKPRGACLACRHCVSPAVFSMQVAPHGLMPQVRECLWARPAPSCVPSRAHTHNLRLTSLRWCASVECRTWLGHESKPSPTTPRHGNYVQSPVWGVAAEAFGARSTRKTSGGENHSQDTPTQHKCSTWNEMGSSFALAQLCYTLHV